MLAWQAGGPEFNSQDTHQKCRIYIVAFAHNSRAKESEKHVPKACWSIHLMDSRPIRCFVSKHINRQMTWIAPEEQWLGLFPCLGVCMHKCAWILTYTGATSHILTYIHTREMCWMSFADISSLLTAHISIHGHNRPCHICSDSLFPVWYSKSIASTFFSPVTTWYQMNSFFFWNSVLSFIYWVTLSKYIFLYLSTEIEH